MKPSKTQEIEIWQVYDTWLTAYLNADVKTYASYIDDDYHFIGSTDNEEFLNKTDTTKFFENTADQLAGKCDLRNETKIIEKFEGLVFITHLFDAWFLNGNDYAYYGRFRFSNALKENKAGWRFIYQHFSTTDSKADEGETIGFDKVNAENIELKEAIKRRTIELETKNRELEIEGALERIRAQAVAMKTSTDLLDIVVTMRTEFIKLGHEAHYFWHMMWLPETYEKAMTSGDGSKIGFVMKLPRHIHGDIPLLANWEKSKDSTVVYAMSTEEAIAYVDKMVALGDFQNIDPQAPTHDDIGHIGGLTFIMARTSHGEIGYSLPGIVENPQKEDIDILVKFAGAFDLAHRRFLDLQKAEKQAREVEIELALEKVRSRTMAMQNSDELSDAAAEVFKQIQLLGIHPWSFGFNIFSADHKTITQWVSSADGRPIPPFDSPATEDVFVRFTEAAQQGAPLYIEQLGGKELVVHYEYMSSLPALGDVFQKLKAAGFELPSYQVFNLAFFKQGYLMFITYEPVEASYDIFKRFAKVFEQTYTRFLDLQQAETQESEAKIEAALERVRSRSMAMHESDELQEVIQVVYDQFVQLQVKVEHAGFILNYKENEVMHIWLADHNAVFPKIVLPYFDCAHWNSFIEAKKKGQNLFTNQLGFEEKNKFYNDLFQFIPDIPEETKTTYFGFEGLAISTVLLDTVGLYIENYSGNPFSDEENVILMRFGKVFQQAYTRFVDLQKAEAQEREAKIEAALERVRSSSMAMHKTDQLQEVVRVVSEELKNTGVILDTWGAVICTYFQDSKDVLHWTASEDPANPSIAFLLPYFKDELYDEAWISKNREDSYFAKVFSFDVKNAFFKYAFEHSDYKKLPEDYKKLILESENHGIAWAWSKNSAIMIPSIQGDLPSEDEKEILIRFAKVFEQSFIRFLDLQKAEEQAQEAQIELSLERIRAKVASMQESSDLFDIVVSMRTEFLSLGHQADYFWHMRWLPESYEMSMTSEDGKLIGMVITLPKFVHEDIPELDEWKKGNDPIFVLALDANGAWNYIEKMNTHGAYELAHPNAPSQKDIEQKKGLTFIMARTTHGEIGFSLAGEVPKPTKESLETLVRFAGVFDLAYKRFEDLKAAEHQALMIREERDRLEIALNELRATQAQLVQQEKLASLGQLTAGIAHEIKNPLNFVNNFSEVSIELIEEALEEINQIENNPHAAESAEILSDVKVNLTKIHEHGSRADSIVKSMLMHSRGGSGKMKPTDLNALIREYVNLSFHGMRAGKNPINISIDLQLDEQINKIGLVEEDFSRLVLNLCNNAFDAMREKLNANQLAPNCEEYRPKLTVRTISKNGKVSIEIEDNGTGIPDDIKDKILQPFFTTKKGTEGTGLGLSITNDIIKAHGGELKVETLEGESTTFIIDLEKKKEHEC